MPEVQRYGRVRWRIVLYDRFGNPIGPIFEASNRKLNFVMNGIDQLDFSLTLDHPMAPKIHQLKSVIKVYRSFSIPTDVRGYYNPDQPVFCGYVGPFDEEGEANTFPVTVYSPLYILIRRFVREMLQYGVPPVTDPPTPPTMDQGEIAMALIDYANSFDYTGISRGDIQPSVNRAQEYNVRTQIWSVIQGLTNLANGFDIIPNYVHLGDGDPTLMQFSTIDALGSPLPKVQFHYNMGNRNLADMVRRFDIEGFCTTVFVDGQGEGQGDPTVTSNTASIMVENADLVSEYGLWERVEKQNTLVDSASLTDYGNTILDQYSLPLELIEPSFTPKTGPYFGRDYGMGDIVVLRAKKGRMDFVNMKRIYGVSLEMSSENLETANMDIAHDTSGQVVDTGFDYQPPVYDQNNTSDSPLDPTVIDTPPVDDGTVSADVAPIYVFNQSGNLVVYYEGIAAMDSPPILCDAWGRPL